LPATVTISATVSDSDGTVAKVEFFDGATLLGTLTAGPYQWVGTLAAGPHTLTARATDNLGAGTTSTAVNITVNSASSPIVLGQPVRGADGTTLTLNWSGGTGPYAVQTQAAAGGAWQDLTVTVAPGPVAAALTGTSGNFRVADLANFVGTPADVQLTGAAVRPTPVGGAGTGSGTWSVNLSTLNLDLTYTGLSGSLSGVTLRGPATTNEVGAVLLDLGALAGVAGHVNGQVALTTEQKAWVLGGQTYLSIQTAAHPEGEIRGQLIR